MELKLTEAIDINVRIWVLLILLLGKCAADSDESLFSDKRRTETALNHLFHLQTDVT